MIIETWSSYDTLNNDKAREAYIATIREIADHAKEEKNQWRRQLETMDEDDSRFEEFGAAYRAARDTELVIRDFLNELRS